MPEKLRGDPPRNQRQARKAVYFRQAKRSRWNQENPDTVSVQAQDNKWDFHADGVADKALGDLSNNAPVKLFDITSEQKGVRSQNRLNNPQSSLDRQRGLQSQEEIQVPSTFNYPQSQAFQRGSENAAVALVADIHQKEEMHRLNGEEVWRAMQIPSVKERKRQLTLLVKRAKRKRGSVPRYIKDSGSLAEYEYFRQAGHHPELPDQPAEWAWAIDRAMAAHGKWYRSHMDAARQFAATDGLLIIDLCCGILTTLYGCYLAGVKVYRCYGVDIDDKGDKTHVIGTRLAATISDHAPDLIAPQVVRDLRELGDDVSVLAQHLDRVTKVITEAPKGVPICIPYEWPCVQNSLRDWQNKPQPGSKDGRWTDKVLAACEVIVKHAKKIAQEQGRC